MCDALACTANALRTLDDLSFAHTHALFAMPLTNMIISSMIDLTR